MTLFAIALVTVEATIGAIAGEKPIDGATFAALLRSHDTLTAASEELGDAIVPEAVQTFASGDRVRFAIQGEGRQAALARCHALIRAVDRRVTTDEPRKQATKFLREEWLSRRREHEQLTSALAPDAPARTKALVRELLAAKLDACPTTRPLPRVLEPFNAECVDAKRELMQQLERYGENHPAILALRAKPAAIERRFEDARQQAIVDATVQAKLATQPAPQKAVMQRRADELATLLIVLAEKLAGVDREPVVPRLRVIDVCH